MSTAPWPKPRNCTAAPSTRPSREWGLDWHWTRAEHTRLLKTTGGKERIARHMAETGASSVDIPALHRAKTVRYTALMGQGAMTLRAGVAGLIAQGPRGPGCGWPWRPPRRGPMSRR